jgi:hypothetical protein
LFASWKKKEHTTKQQPHARRIFWQAQAKFPTKVFSPVDGLNLQATSKDGESIYDVVDTFLTNNHAVLGGKQS